MKAHIPGLAVDFDPISQSPKWIGSASKLLGGDQAVLVMQNADAPVLRFLEEQRELFGHGPEVLEQARRVTDYRTARSSTRKVVWHQQLDGIDIFEAVFQANLTADGGLINVGSQLIAQPTVAAGGEGRAMLVAAPPVTVEAAVAQAGQHVGEKMTASGVKAVAPPAARPDRRQAFRAAMLTDAEAGLVWVPMDAATLRLAWDVTLTSRVRGEMYRVLVDAETAAVLVRQSLTAYNTEASYRVFTTESPTPMSPGHETVSSLQPPRVERALVTTAAVVPAASPAGWLAADENITTGNNADAYTDANADNVADLPRTDGGPGRVFDFSLDLNLEPWTHKDASVTQLFYWTNFAHDRLYELGFTEAAGNFQLANFGRGGEGSDPVNAEAQDGSGTNNANFSTPVDGGRGRMQMYNWTTTTPHRDGAFDVEIVLHEYAHGLSNRLVGGPSVTITALSSRGMGEGWSDFYGMALTAEAGENPQGNWAHGGYARYQANGWFSENYYYGGRRYSYSPDMRKNPHTFRDIDPTQVDWHTDVPRSPTHAATQDATQVHYQGTVWCTMLWEMRANLVMKHGFATGNERALFLVTEGMKLGPANPNFVQARDGILQAALVNHPEDVGEVWAAFAKRGLGEGATAPASTSSTGVTESYRVPDALELSDRSGWNITGGKGGPFAPAEHRLTLRHDGAEPFAWTAASTVPWLVCTPAVGSLQPGAEVVVTVRVQAGAEKAGFHSGQVVFQNLATGFTQPVGVRLYVAAPVVKTFSLDQAPAGWTTTGEWAHGVPAGGGGIASGGHGQADPTTGATGTKVYGASLSGNPSSTPSGPFYLTSAALDFTAYKSTRLRFQRWLNAPGLTNNRITVEVRAQGTPWREIFVNGSTETADGEWKPMDYDISSLADGRLGVQVRWGYQPLANAGNYAGWNVDDVQFLAEPQTELTLELAESVEENAAAITGTVHLDAPRPQAVTVALSSSDASAAMVPVFVTFQPGQVSQNFTVQPVDDALLDGSQSVVITASSPGIAPGVKTLVVTDNESAVLVLTVPANVHEGDLPVTGQLSVTSPPAREVQVRLTSSVPGVSVPAVVTLPAGSIGPVTWTMSGPDNAWAEGNRTVTLTATVPGWSMGQCEVVLTDDDRPLVMLTGADSASEGDGALTLTATVNTLHATDVVLQLTSSDGSELAVPATVTIPAGQSQVAVPVTVLDDDLRDGRQQVLISASIIGYAAAGRTVTVADNDVDRYSFSAVASPQKRHKPFMATLTALDVQGEVITGHRGGLAFSSVSAAGPVPFYVATLSEFSQGVAAVSLVVTTTSPSMTLTATDAAGRLGISAAFAVEAVQHDGFVWTGLPGQTMPDIPITGSVTAVDDLGAAIASYQEATVVDTWMAPLTRTVGSTTVEPNISSVYNTTASDSRVQILYTAAELGTFARWLGRLDLSSSSGKTLRSFTIRLKHSNLESLAGATWEENGWTTVYSDAAFLLGSSQPTFPRPFFYNGVQNLMVDISFRNLSQNTETLVRGSQAASTRLLSGSSDGLHGDPLTWTAATGPVPVRSNDLPTLLLYELQNMGAVADSPLAFTAGTAAVQTFIPQAPLNVVWLRALAPSGIVGFSSPIWLSTPPVLSASDLVLFESFETGSLGPQWSTADSSPTARAQVTTAYTPRLGSRHLTLDAPTTTGGSYVRNSPTLTVNLAGRSHVSVEWYAKEFQDESHPAQSSGPLGTLAADANFDGIAISQDGVTWHEIATFTTLTSGYGSLATRVYLDPIVQHLGWSYNASFKIRFSQYDDQAIGSDGIAIDGIAIRANPVTAVGVALPPVIMEGSLNVPVEITLPTASATSTTVSLTSYAGARVSILNSPLIIPAGQTTATVLISAPQNQITDLGKAVVISVTATGRPSSYHNIRVLDDEVTSLSLSLPASVTEGNPAATVTVRLSSFFAQAVPVYLESASPGELGVASSVVSIPAGQNTATFAISAVDDPILDGSQEISLTTSANGVQAATATVQVLDNENRQMVMTEPAPLREGGTASEITLSLSGPRPVPTVLELTTSDPGEATVPATVVIPAGEVAVSFEVSPVNDLVRDGEQTVLIRVSAEGLLGSAVMVQVLDDEPARIVASPIASPQVQGAEIQLTLTALDETGALIPYHGTALLTARSGAYGLPVTPAAPIAFVQGTWAGAVSLGEARGGVVLVITTPGGLVSLSPPFDVNPATVPGGLVVPVPVLNPEPLFTSGVANQVLGPAVPAEVEFQVEAAVDAAFAQSQFSPWLPAPNYTFGGLVDGQTYHYRARSRVAIGSMAAQTWAQAVTAAEVAWSSSEIGSASAGTFESPVIQPASLHRWGTLVFSPAQPVHMAVAVDILAPSGEVLATAVPSGTDLHALTGGADIPAIRLRARLTSSVTGEAAGALSWSVSHLPLPAFVYSAPSAVVSSTQDSMPPSLELLTPAIRHLCGATAEIAGLAWDVGSGLASVTVNGQPLLSISGYASWQHSLTGLQDGAHTFTITATDCASPPNTTTVISRIHRIADPAGDHNGNGIADLLDHALGIPPAVSQGPSGLPHAFRRKSLVTGEAALLLTYHRHIERSGLHYTVETSENLTEWDASGQDVVEESVMPNDDGLTETVQVRVMPELGLQRAKFVRVQVGVD
ncbi:MAG: M36 family metallopeptidase [Verrucomicrobiota bacterium]